MYLPLELVNKIVMMSVPKYVFVEELNYYRQCWEGFQYETFTEIQWDGDVTEEEFVGDTPFHEWFTDLSYRSGYYFDPVWGMMEITR